jgi:adenylate cyclase
LNLLGSELAEQEVFEEAHKHLNEAMTYVEQGGTKLHRSLVLNTMGNTNYYQGENQKALECWEKAYAVVAEMNDQSFLNIIRMNIGNVYYSTGNYPMCQKAYFEALKWAEENNEREQALDCLINIGALSGDQGRSDFERQYYNKALKDYSDLMTPHLRTIILENLAGIYIDYDRNTDEAERIAYEILEIGKSNRMRGREGSAYKLLGITANVKKQRTTARGYYEKAIGIFQEDNNLGEYNNTMIHLVEVDLNAIEQRDTNYIAQFFKGQPTLALQDARRNLNTVIAFLKKQEEANRLVEAYGLLSQIERLSGNYKEALEHYTYAKELNDTLVNAERDKKLTEAAMQYDFDKKEAITRAEQEKSDQRQRLLRNSILAGLGFTLLFLVVVWRQRNRISKEKARSESLLLNILPSEVAEELKATGAAEAKHFAKTTILFTDFKNFTELSEWLSPTELVEELNKCFKAFDDITGRYQIEKIKTIGDAYMAAGGLPDPKYGSPADVVRAALDMQMFMLQHRAEREALGKPFFEMRVGVNTGPVVAGIVGVKKFQYDIWGDTVNTAARLESTGDVGKVNISETTWDLVKDAPEFAFEHRGKIEAKGKGLIDMWFVERKAI